MSSVFDLSEATAILARTPRVLRSMLEGLPEPWLRCDEGEATWSPFDVVGHLIDGERTDWIPRARIILEHGAERAFEPFDRFAHLEANRGRSLAELLDELEALRRDNLEALAAMELEPSDFARRGRHPELGEVTLGELLATWVAHDLGHLAQVSRVMAKRYRGAIGPWRAYIPVVDR